MSLMNNKQPCEVCGMEDGLHAHWCLMKPPMVAQQFPFTPPEAPPKPPQYGWLCPRCQMANSPHNSMCGNPMCGPLKFPGGA